MFATERQRRILEHLRTNVSATIQELAAHSDCSEVTIRRDLLSLENQGLIDRHRGGATVRDIGEIAPVQAHLSPTEAPRLTRLAATLVSDGETIALGSGTTIAQLAAALSTKSSLTVVTNSMLVTDALAASDVSTIMVGGSLRGSTMAVVGSEAERVFTELRVSRVFLSGDGLTQTWGLSGADAASSSVERAMAAAAEEVVVVAESTIVGTDALSLIVPSARISQVVTMSRGSAAVLEGLRSQGVNIRVPDNSQEDVA